MSEAAASADENFYELLEIDPGADADTIQQTLRTLRRQWRQRTGSPDPEKRRLAEAWMDRIGRAETQLLDPAARSTYDQALEGRSQPEAPAPSTASTRWGERAAQYLRDDDAKNALVAAKRGVDADPDDTESWLMYARAALKLEHLDEADFASAELLHRVPIAENLVFRGGILDQMGRYGEAEQLFRRAAQEDPSSAFAASRAAWAVLDQGRLEDAVEEAWSVIDAFPDDDFPPRVLQAASGALRGQEQPERALEIAERLLTLRPDDDAIMLETVLSLEGMARQGQGGRALSHAKRLLEEHPGSDRPRAALRFVTASLFDAGGTDAAVEESWFLLERYPEDDLPPRILRLACERLRDQGRPSQALPIALRLLRARPGVDENMRQAVATIEAMADIGEIGAAFDHGWQVLAEYPEEIRPRRTMTYLIGTLRDSGHPAQALLQARELLTRFPEDAEVKRCFAWARIREAEAAMSQTPDGGFVMLNAAQEQHYRGAIAEIEALGIQEGDVPAHLARMREYHLQQSAVAVKLGCWRIAGAAVALLMVIYGLSELVMPGLPLVVIGGLLAWWVVVSATRKKYQRDAKTWPPAVRASGLQA